MPLGSPDRAAKALPTGRLIQALAVWPSNSRRYSNCTALNTVTDIWNTMRWEADTCMPSRTFIT